MTSRSRASLHRSDPGHYRFFLLAVLALALSLFFILAVAPNAQAASMYIIQNDATGGDCPLIGTWDDVSDTCTLTTDIAVVIPGDIGVEIVDSGVTLNGNSHKITGLGPTPPPPSPDPWIAEHALVLTGITDTEVLNLVVDSIDEGITLDGGSGNLINYNEVNDVTRGIIPAISSTNQIVHNTCDGALWTCVDVVASDSNTVGGNTLTTSGEWGVRLFEGDDNNILYNTISNKGTPREGLGTGVWIYYADNNLIDTNTIEGMNYGVLATAGTGNSIILNNFLGNVIQAEDAGGNFFDIGILPSNLWDDFDEPSEGCFDADVNGICDAPYVFTGNQDNRPRVGRPDLRLSLVNVYWASYEAYLSGILSVDYSLADAGAVAALDVQALGTINTSGVTDASTLPLSVGNITAGASAPFTLLYNIPPGAGSFRSTVYLTAENNLGLVYNYPGPFPGP